MDMPYLLLPNYLRMHRKRRGWSQDEVARRCGTVSGSIVGAHERGSLPISLRWQNRYLELYGADLRDLFPPPTRSRGRRILGLYPKGRSLGYAIVESQPTRVVDWGTHKVTGRSRIGLTRSLITRYQPSHLVVEKPDCMPVLRKPKQRSFPGLIARRFDAVTPVVQCDLRRVRTKLAPGESKHEVTWVLVSIFPELAPLLHPRRNGFAPQSEKMIPLNGLTLAIGFLLQGARF